MKALFLIGNSYNGEEITVIRYVFKEKAYNFVFYLEFNTGGIEFEKSSPIIAIDKNDYNGFLDSEFKELGMEKDEKETEWISWRGPYGQFKIRDKIIKLFSGLKMPIEEKDTYEDKELNNLF